MLPVLHWNVFRSFSIKSEESWAYCKEKNLGIFYRKAKPFLHFHEDRAGLFADLSVGAEFDRYPVNTRVEWRVLLSAIDQALKL